MTGAKKVRLCYRETKSTDGGARGGLMAPQKKHQILTQETAVCLLFPADRDSYFLFF